MAYNQNLKIISRDLSSTSPDLSTRAFHFVTENANGVILNTTDGGACLGVLQSNISTDGAVADIGAWGVAKVWYHGSTGSTETISLLSKIKSSTTGRAQLAATAGNYVMGLALTAVSSGSAAQLGEILLLHQGQLSS